MIGDGPEKNLRRKEVIGFGDDWEMRIEGWGDEERRDPSLYTGTGGRDGTNRLPPDNRTGKDFQVKSRTGRLERWILNKKVWLDDSEGNAKVIS